MLASLLSMVRIRAGVSAGRRLTFGLLGILCYVDILIHVPVHVVCLTSVGSLKSPERSSVIISISTTSPDSQRRS
jgi:hypothetical protein